MKSGDVSVLVYIDVWGLRVSFFKVIINCGVLR